MRSIHLRATGEDNPLRTSRLTGLTGGVLSTNLGPIMGPDETSANDDKPDLLDAAVQIWRTAQVVRNPGRKGETPSEAMVRTIADEIDKYRERLVECLSRESQLVTAYALLVLSKVNDPVLNELPTELLTRHEKITVRSGSFSEKMELGAFARMLRKKAWTRLVKEKGLPPANK